MNTAKAMLIDFDGTLANTQPANHAAYAQALSEQGIEIDFTTFMHYSDGKHWSEFLPPIIEAYAPSKPIDAKAIAQRKTEIYKNMAHLISFNEPLIMLLKTLAGHCPLAIVTTASKANVTSALSLRQDISSLFSLMITGEDVRQHKPHPEAYFVAAEKLGVNAEDCVIFEDSVAGIQAAKAFGGMVIKTYL